MIMPLEPPPDLSFIGFDDQNALLNEYAGLFSWVIFNLVLS